MTEVHTNLLTAAQLARVWGVSRQNVHQLAKKGLILRRPDGLFDEDDARRCYARNTDPAYRKASRLGADPVNGAAARSVKSSRQVKAAVDVWSAKLKSEEETDNLMKADDVGRLWFSVFRTMRDRLLQLPDWLSYVIATEIDAKVVKAAMKTELRRIVDDAERQLPPPPTEPILRSRSRTVPVHVER